MNKKAVALILFFMAIIGLFMAMNEHQNFLNIIGLAMLAGAYFTWAKISGRRGDGNIRLQKKKD